MILGIILKDSYVQIRWYGRFNGQAGNPIAYAYNLDDLYVTANIDEKDIKDVEVGKDVDVTIDSIKSF